MSYFSKVLLSPLSAAALLAVCLLLLLVLLAAAFAAHRLFRAASGIRGESECARRDSAVPRARTGHYFEEWQSRQDALEEEEEEEEDWSVEADEDAYVCGSQEVTVAVMPDVRDSLYAAVAHQLYEQPVGSPQHRDLAAWLRNSVQPQLRARRGHSVRPSRHSDDAEFPGDLEELGALADLLGASLVVYPEGGSPLTVPSSSAQASPLRLGLRQPAAPGGAWRHYDSVLAVSRAIGALLASEVEGLEGGSSHDGDIIDTESEMSADGGEVNRPWRGPPLDTFSTPREVVTVVRTADDGDSLFAALAHQLSAEPVGSARHRRLASELRADVASELLERADRYLHLVGLRAAGSPAGDEALKAAANTRGVDVVVYPEGGGVAFVARSSADQPRAVVSVSRRPDARRLYHYDSVVSVTPIRPAGLSPP